MDTWQAHLEALSIAVTAATPTALMPARTQLAAAWSTAQGRAEQAATLSWQARLEERAGRPDHAASAWFLAHTLGTGFLEPAALGEYSTPLARLRTELDYDAVIVAGGAGHRFGTPDKPLAPLAGWPLLDHVLLATAGATNRIVVGPKHRRSRLGQPTVCQEDPPGAGPGAALGAGLSRVRQPMVAVLAADLPLIGDALSALRDAATAEDVDAAVLVDTSGRMNYLAAMWQTSALLRTIDAAGHLAEKSMRSLYDRANVVTVADFDAAGQDCDTVADLHKVAERIRPHRGGPLPPTLLAWPRLELFPPS